MKSIRVKADLQCPFCGYCEVIKLGSHRKAVTCPDCRQAVYLSWATGIEGELDSKGNYFKACDPLNLRQINREFQDVFVEDYHYWLR